MSTIIFKIYFQEVARPVGRPNRHILEILLAHSYTLVGQNVERVLGYTTACNTNNTFLFIIHRFKKGWQIPLP